MNSWSKQKDLTCPFGDAGHVDTYYKYVVGGRSAGAVLGDEVIVYEPVEIHGGGANVLYGDGHVEWIDASGFQRWVIEEVGKNTDRSENGQPTVR